MTRHSYVYAFDAVTPNPLDRAAMEPGRRRLRNDLPNVYLCKSADFVADAETVKQTGGIMRPDRRSPLRNGRYPTRFLFDYVAAGM